MQPTSTSSNNSKDSISCGSADSNSNDRLSNDRLNYNRQSNENEGEKFFDCNSTNTGVQKPITRRSSASSNKNVNEDGNSIKTISSR